MSHPVTVYTLPSCVQCSATERKLTQLGIPFEAVSAAEHTDELKSLGHLTAPVVVVDHGSGQVDSWSGYCPDRLEALA